VGALGGVANEIPLANAYFRMFIINMGWEHFWSKYQRGIFKTSGEMGMYFMINDGFAPVPYAQLNWYLGKYPYYFKLGVGALFELLIGGHVAGYIRPGIEIFEHIEWSIFYALGTHPRKNYTKRGTNGSSSKLFTYWAMMFTFKI